MKKIWFWNWDLVFLVPITISGEVICKMRFIKHTNQTHTLTQTRTHKYSKWVMQAYLQAAHRSWNRQSALRVILFYNGEWDLFWLIGITHRRSLVPKQQNDGDGSSVVICISPVSSHFVTWFTDWLIRSQFCGSPPLSFRWSSFQRAASVVSLPGS